MFFLTEFFDTLRRPATILGWGTLLLIVCSTLSPIELRPHIPDAGPDLERFLAYFAASSLLAFAYPRQRWLVLVGLFVLAVGLECAQNWEATRHGRMHDALVKALGVLIGGGLAISFDYLARFLRRTA